MKLILLCSLFYYAHAIWWWFSTDVDSNDNLVNDVQGAGDTSVAKIFAPFEISTGEQKFLIEAQHYLQNLPMLDQCNLLIINRLKTSCNKLSDEQLSKLSVNLLNCQSAVEERTVYKCSDDMNLVDCTKSMDSDTWNSYHIISNRARAICHSVRQAEFRMKTEQTVNRLASATLENVDILKNLASGQKQLQEAANEAIDTITHNQDNILSKQDDFQEKQSYIGSIMNDNMHSLIKEKNVISQRHKQVEEYTQMINYQLASLVKEIKSQELSKKENEKELLKDLDTVKVKADEVLKKLEVAFVDMDSYHENLEGKQNKTLQNLEEIQEAIAFMSKILTKLYASVDEQLPWLHEMFGSTIDKLTMATLIFGHAMYFLAVFFAVIFINAPSVTRLLMLVVIPLNCLAALQGYHNLTYIHMSWVLALTIPVHYVICKVARLIAYFRNGKHHEVVVMDTKHQSTLTRSTVTRDLTPVLSLRNTNEDLIFPSKQANLIKSGQGIFDSMSSTPQKQVDKQFILETMEPTYTSSPHIREAVIKYQDSPKQVKQISTPPLKRRSFANLTSSPGLDTTAGGSLKCSSYTKSGLRCKNAATGCTTTCRVHTPQK